MQGYQNEAHLCVVGFAPVDARELESVADRLGFKVKVYIGSRECLLLLPRENPMILLVDIEGIETFAPSFIASTKRVNTETAIVCVGDGILTGLVDQLKRAGTDFIVNKQVLLTSIKECSKRQAARPAVHMSQTPVNAPSSAYRSDATLKRLLLEQFRGLSS